MVSPSHSLTEYGERRAVALAQKRVAEVPSRKGLNRSRMGVVLLWRPEILERIGREMGLESVILIALITLEIEQGKLE